jgi:arabinofuranosyltransferase
VTCRAGSARTLPLWLALAGLVGGAYLVFSAATNGVEGFPLDDAWIHQTYARSLGTTGAWAFMPGQTSAGSTAPLWSLLVALGYRLGLPHLAWTYSLGVGALGLTGWLAAALAETAFPERPWAGWLTGLLCVAEWHMVWAAVSGMETALYVCLALLVLRLAGTTLQPDPKSGAAGSTVLHGTTSHAHLSFDICHLRFVILGIVAGLLVLTRPDGLVLVGLVALSIAWRLRHNRSGLALRWAALGLGLSLPLTPYLVWHYSISGLPFPNTFYAKQQEYREALELFPLWQRWAMVVSVTMVGSQALLVPGCFYTVLRALKGGRIRPSGASDNARWLVLLLVGWSLAHLTLYALRLPVTYHHGRYEMPVIPALVVIGVGGTASLLGAVHHRALARILRRATLVSGGLLCAAFLVMGARSYAADVAFIQGEMVATARWLSQNTPSDSLVAVHDIGAVGYFADRRLLDLAGLVTPQVIPIITDEAALVAYMRSQGADYVVFFPDWSAAYRRMAHDPHLEMVYSTGFEWTRAQGRANMTVYRWSAGNR